MMPGGCDITQKNMDDWNERTKHLKPDHHAEREQVAREWIRESFPGLYVYGSNLTEYRVSLLVALLASRESAVLEEAAELAVREECETDDPLNHACRIAERLRQMAQDRRP